MNTIESPYFPRVDTALRMGSHITTDDYVSHEFVAQNFSWLFGFYARYEASLTQHPDGFFFLQTDGSVIPNKSLSKSCMHLGQLLAYLTRQPAITKTRGIVTLDEIHQTLSTMFSAELLGKIYVPTAKENGTAKQIKKEVFKSLRILTRLNFLTFENGMKAVRITPAIGRFAEMARHDNDPSPAASKDLEIKRGVKFDDPSDVITPQEDENDDD